MNRPTLARLAPSQAPAIAAIEGPQFSSDNPVAGFVAFLAEHTRVGQRSARLYVGHLQRFAAWLRDRYQAGLLEGTTRDLREYRAQLAARHKPASVDAALAALRRFYAWAAELHDYVNNFVAQTTFERYRGIIRRYIVPRLGRKTLEQLSTSHIQRYYSDLKDQGFAVATISLHHSVLYHSLHDARRAGLVGRNVAEDVKKPRERERDATHRAFTPEQRVRLEQAIRGHQHESLWLILLLTGIRIGEAAALTWDDVDLGQARLIVRKSYRRALSGPIVSEPKTKRGRRTIPLGETALAALLAQRARTRPLKLRTLKWEDLNLVFPNSLGRPLRADKVLLEFKRVLKSAGLPERRLHDLRHTYATELYAADVHPRSVQELLGHSRLDMTNDLYTGSVPDALRSAVEQLDRARARQAR